MAEGKYKVQSSVHNVLPLVGKNGQGTYIWVCMYLKGQA